MTETPDEAAELDEAVADDANSESANTDLGITEAADAEPDDDPDTFPREVVEELRRENGKHRQRAQKVAHRLHNELVRATGRLADPTDLEFDEDHLDDPEALNAAIDELLERKPHLASRRPTGDIGQGNRGPTSEPFSLLGLLKEHT